jgi:RNA polymerase sigma factor (sigma-70 family)
LSETLKIRSQFLTSDVNVSVHTELSILIRDCIAQSASAQKKMYDLYAPAAYGVIKRYFYNDEPTAQEILNDSFFKVLTKLAQYTFQGSFEGWIRRIVVNTVTDYLRKKIKDEHHKDVQPEDAYVNSESVEKLSHKELLKLVQSLPEVQRAVFNLYVFENYPHKEIAAILNINENNSRWHLNDARKRLKEKINFVMK